MNRGDRVTVCAVVYTRVGAFAENRALGTVLRGFVAAVLTDADWSGGLAYALTARDLDNKNGPIVRASDEGITWARGHLYGRRLDALLATYALSRRAA